MLIAKCRQESTVICLTVSYQHFKMSISNFKKNQQFFLNISSLVKVIFRILGQSSFHTNHYYEKVRIILLLTYTSISTVNSKDRSISTLFPAVLSPNPLEELAVIWGSDPIFFFQCSYSNSPLHFHYPDLCVFHWSCRAAYFRLFRSFTMLLYIFFFLSFWLLHIGKEPPPSWRQDRSSIVSVNLPRHG